MAQLMDRKKLGDHRGRDRSNGALGHVRLAHVRSGERLHRRARPEAHGNRSHDAEKLAYRMKNGPPSEKIVIQIFRSGLAGVEGLEPPTPGFGDRCSSH
jgi:hypothetical protein